MNASSSLESATSPIASSADEGAAATAVTRRLRRGLSLALLVAAALFFLDVSRAPEVQWTARALVAGIHLYQAVVSPRLAAVGAGCRFTPSCSHYAEAAIRRDGAVRGTVRAVLRIARCGPWTEPGTYDPP